jgi:hypothetical protein
MIGVIGIVIGVLLSTAVVFAGSLDPSAGPTDPGSQMYTLEQIYDRLSGDGNANRMGAFQEPSSAPGSTMHTLDDIYALAWPARVPKTGARAMSGYTLVAGEDGFLQKGVTWPNPRFTDNNNGTVTDKLTGLIWLKTANCSGQTSWAYALSFANMLASGACGLADGSVAGAWRLPNIREMQSLLDYAQPGPILPGGHPFTGVQSTIYWTSTTARGNTSSAWYVSLTNGYVNSGGKSGGYYVWPVRDGQ